MKEIIKQLLATILPEVSLENVIIDFPSDSSHGDYFTNVAFVASKLLKISPFDAAEQIVSKLKAEKGSEAFSSIQAVKPGFINFTILPEVVGDKLVSLDHSFGISRTLEGKTYIVEYSSPNIAKPFTIGHLRSTIIGDAIANLLQSQGALVKRDNHVGDWGTQFGKLIYAIKKWDPEKKFLTAENPVKALVSLYIQFHDEAEKDSMLENKGREEFKKLEDKDAQAVALWKECIDASWIEFDKIYKQLGVVFTENSGHGFSESSVESYIPGVIKELEEKKLLSDSEGARVVFFPNNELPPLLIMKSDGATIYATRDLATDLMRLKTYGNDISIINEIGSEQSLYMQQIYRTEEMLGWFQSSQRIHVKHGLYRFKEGKMSTRKGNVIWLEDVLEEAKKRAFTLQKRTSEVDETLVITNNHKKGKAQEHIMGYAARIDGMDQVAIGALKWNDLKRNSHMDIAFDWDEVLNMQGNSGPYLQYSYVRTQSVLKKADKLLVTNPLDMNDLQEEEIRLSRMLLQFDGIVAKAAKELSPSTLCTYLYEVAKLFSSFYQACPILTAENDAIRIRRLLLTKVSGIVLGRGLKLLGISTPDQM